MRQGRLIRYHALVDIETDAILALSLSAPAILFLQEAIPYAHAATSLQYPNYPQDFPLRLDEPESHISWTWNRRARRLEKTDAAVMTDALKEKARLAGAKLTLIVFIMNILSRARIQAARGYAHQDAIYLSKKMQAKAFKDAQYNVRMLPDVPYVQQYAEYASIPPNQAADEILLKAKLDDERLAKTELIRLVYSNKIKRAATLQELEAIREEFQRDTVGNARLS